MRPASVALVHVVGRVVVADQADFFVRSYGLVDHAQKPQPLLMAVLLLAYAVDLAIGGVERGEQGGRAVALVVMRHGLAAPLFERQAGLRAIQRVNLTLLTYRQHQRVLGRVEIEFDNRLQFVSELTIVADLKTLEAMRLETAGPLGA